MNVNSFAENLRPAEVLAALIDRHGVFRVILALPSALVTRRKAGFLVDNGLSHHMRRDIGLIDEGRSKQYWELR